jgi:ribosome-associated protein
MAKSERTRKRTGSGKLPAELLKAIEAARDKQAGDAIVLDLRRAAAFTDFFLVCTGRNVRQVKAIADAIEEALRAARVRPTLVEGYDRAEWVLIDYFDFVVHIFTPEARQFYSLERLWGSAERLAFPDVGAAPPPGAAGPQP